MSSPSKSATGQTVNALRGLILHGLLLVLLILLGTGLSLLVGMALRGLVVDDDRQLVLATALAFTVIPGPLAWLLWVWIRKKLIDAHPTDAAIWSLQGAAVYLIALVMSSVALLRLLSGLVDSIASNSWQELTGTVVGWGLVAFWQFRMLNSVKYAPRELPHLAACLGNAYALGLTAFSLAAALRTALDLLFVPSVILVGQSPLPRLLGSVIWVLGAALLWFWHWKLQRVQALRDIFSSFVVMLVGVCLAALATLLAAAATLNIVIPLPWDFIEMGRRFADSGPLAISALLSGAIFWTYHHWQLAGRGLLVVTVSRQIISGISLALLASGLGMVVNALLASVSSPLNSDTAPSVLRTGIALAVVGVVFWALYFRPGVPADPESRRVYLVLFFGVSAVVALVALLIVGYRVFEILVAGTSAALNLLDYIRAPLGWLLATAGVSAYHFALWKSDRERLAAQRPQAPAAPSAGSPVPAEPAPAAARTVIVVAPHGSDHLLATLQLTEGLVVRWIASSGPRLPEEITQQLVNRITETLAARPGSLLAVAGSDGQVSFTELAD